VITVLQLGQLVSSDASVIYERELFCGFEPIADGINPLRIIIIIIIIIIITLSVLVPSGREVPTL
jgi:hypothetical protein